MIASVGGPVDPTVADAVPITDEAANPQLPKLNWQTVPDLPPELQPAPGDILLKQPVWPWEDLGAQGIPEKWLYMSRHVQGTIALLAVQTPQGPKLVNANPDGTLVQAAAQLQAPINTPTNYKAIDVVIAAGANSGNLLGIAANDFRQLYWYYASLELEAAIAAQSWLLQFGIQNPFARFSTAIAGPRIINLGGTLMPRNHTQGNVEDLLIQNNGAAAIAIKGYVSYTLA